MTAGLDGIFDTTISDALFNLDNGPSDFGRDLNEEWMSEATRPDASVPVARATGTGPGLVPMDGLSDLFAQPMATPLDQDPRRTSVVTGLTGGGAADIATSSLGAGGLLNLPPVDTPHGKITPQFWGLTNNAQDELRAGRLSAGALVSAKAGDFTITAGGAVPIVAQNMPAAARAEIGVKGPLAPGVNVSARVLGTVVEGLNPVITGTLGVNAGRVGAEVRLVENPNTQSRAVSGQVSYKGDNWAASIQAGSLTQPGAEPDHRVFGQIRINTR